MQPTLTGVVVASAALVRSGHCLRRLAQPSYPEPHACHPARRIGWPGPFVVKGRLYRLALIASTFGYCWLGMQIVHELGLVLTAWASGDTVR